MQSIWGYRLNNPVCYRHATLLLIESLIDDRRRRFKAEYKNALDNRNGLCLGKRFNTTYDIASVLESNVPEKLFRLTPELYIDKVLLGASEADYYYTYEKEY